MPAPLRLSGVKFGGQSVASKAFEQYDPNKDARSFLMPFLPQSGAQFKAADRLGEAFGKKYGKNTPPSLPSAFYEAALNHDWKLARKLRKEVVAAEKASDLIKAAEQPFYGKDGKEFDDEAGEILGYITGYRQVPFEKAKPEPFGIPSTDPAELREQFGLSTTSTSDLRKQFGIR